MNCTFSNYTILVLVWLILFAPFDGTAQKDIRKALVFKDLESHCYISAHRGGRNLLNYPENALETFEYTRSQVPNSIIEFDVNMSADSVLFLMHDNSLDRTTNGSGSVMARDYAYIRGLQLEDDYGNLTSFHPPTLEEVLKWAKKKKVFLTVDIKRGVPLEMVVAALQKYRMKKYAAIITYSVEDALRANQLAPDYMLSVSIRNEAEWQRIKNEPIPLNRIIAFTGTRLSDPSLFKKLHSRGILCILGTLGNLDKSAEANGDQLYCEFLGLGVDILATDRPAQAAQAIRACDH